MKKIIAFFFLLPVLWQYVPYLSVSAQETEEIVDTDDESIEITVDGLVYTMYAPFYELIDVVDKEISTVTIPAELNGYPVSCVSNAFKDCKNLTEIKVEEGNSLLTSDNGVLLSEEEHKVVAYPRAKPGTDYTIPDGYSIPNHAFYECHALRTITLSEGCSAGGRCILELY